MFGSNDKICNLDIRLYICKLFRVAKLKEKSNINLEAAGQLIKLNLYAPSIHCSYYSCYQLLRYAVKEFFGLDYESQDDNMRQSTQNSHSYLIRSYVHIFDTYYNFYINYLILNY